MIKETLWFRVKIKNSLKDAFYWILKGSPSWPLSKINYPINNFYFTDYVVGKYERM